MVGGPVAATVELGTTVEFMVDVMLLGNDADGPKYSLPFFAPAVGPFVRVGVHVPEGGVGLVLPRDPSGLRCFRFRRVGFRVGG